MSKKAILVDTTLCTGCRACQSACMSLNAHPYDETPALTTEYTVPESLSATSWNRVKYVADPGSGTMTMRVEMCYHCENAACIAACPEKAIGKQDGWNVVDIDRCIGCGSCEKACPYHAVFVLDRKVKGMKEKRAYKCHGCIPAGLDKPACVSVCPTGALSYGNRLRQLKRARERVSTLKKEYPRAGFTGAVEHGGLMVITVYRDMKYAGEAMNRRGSGLLIGNVIYALGRPFTAGSERAKRALHKTVRSLFES